MSYLPSVVAIFDFHPFSSRSAAVVEVLPPQIAFLAHTVVSSFPSLRLLWRISRCLASLIAPSNSFTVCPTPSISASIVWLQ